MWIVQLGKELSQLEPVVEAFRRLEATRHELDGARQMREVETDPELRPTPGFLTAEGWTQALGRAGFREIALVPDVARLRDLWKGVITAAVCGRRPHP